LLTEPLPRKAAPAALTLSGGVAEYIFGHEVSAFGDIAQPLAQALAHELSSRSGLPLIDPGQRIRATVIGASQFTVQVSGKTIYLPDPYVLPVRNVPVVHVTMDAGRLDRARIVAEIRTGLDEIDLDNVRGITIAFTWRGDPEHSRLRAAGEAILGALQPVQDQIELLLVAIDGDIGKTFGRLMHHELNWSGKIVCLDGVELHELDYIDLGELIAPPGVVPVVIKSLLFA
jgi:ethanolamine utilization protein EutA